MLPFGIFEELQEYAVTFPPYYFGQIAESRLSHLGDDRSYSAQRASASLFHAITVTNAARLLLNQLKVPNSEYSARLRPACF